MRRLYGYECRRIFGSGLSALLLVFFVLLVGISWFWSVDHSMKIYGVNSTTGFYDDQKRLLSSLELIRKEDEVRAGLAGKMDENWLENFDRKSRQAYIESLPIMYDDQALCEKYSTNWKEDLLEHPDDWAEPLVFYSKAESEEDQNMREQTRALYEKENEGKKRLIYRKDYEEMLETGQPETLLKNGVLEESRIGLVEPLVVERIWENPDGLIPGEFLQDAAGQQIAQGAWPNTNLSGDQIAFYKDILIKQDGFFFGKIGMAVQIFDVWTLLGALFLFLCVWYGSRALSMDQKPEIAETLSTAKMEKKLPWIKAAAVFSGILLSWTLLFGLPLLLSLVTDTFPDLRVNMLAITFLSNIFTIGQGMALTCLQSLLGGAASGAIAFLIGAFFRSSSAAVSVCLPLLFLIPEFFLKGLTGAKLLFPGCLLYSPAMFDWSFVFNDHVVLWWPVYTLWWLFWSVMAVLLAVNVKRRREEAVRTGS